MNEIVKKWRDESKVEVFDINGDPVKTAAAADKADKAEKKAK
jgi:hypothetical protein